MPVKVVKRTGARPYKIVEVHTGRVVGSSANRKKAQQSAARRNQAYRAKKKRQKN